MANAAARVRRSKSTGHGFEHWKAQRVTAIANVFLVLWFVWSAVSLSGLGYAEKTAWLASPINATFMILLVASIFHHARLGLQVVIEDYVHNLMTKTVLLVSVTFAAIVMATACIISIIKVSVGS